MRHAYLVIAHNNYYVLNTLLKLIDDKRNDIYLHIDSKCKEFDFDKYKSMLKYSNVYFVKRHNVLWGEYSLIKAELSLFNEAYQHGEYGYYHLLSGADLPLKNQNYIHDFFDANFGYEFISCATEKHTKECNIINRFNYFLHTERFIYLLFNRFNYQRFKKDFIVSYGSEWVSVTEAFVKCILEHKKWIKKHFRYTHTCDEVYKQCIVVNTEFKNNLYTKHKEENTISFNMRLIDWSEKKAHPKTFTMGDLNVILNSNCLFARKFDELIDKDIVDYIYESVLNN